MKDDQPGLRMRMAQEQRRISSQHRQLDSLYILLGTAIDRGETERALDTFQRFRDALHAHISLEDELYFPAINGLRPDLESELADLAREHKQFRRDLDELEAMFGRGDLAASGKRLELFVDLLTAHERREERLLNGIRPPPNPEAG